MWNTDEDALRAMRVASPALQEWWPDGESPRSWKGVTWSDDRVTELNLEGCELVTLPPEIGQLQALTNLVLYNCEPSTLVLLSDHRTLQSLSIFFCGGREQPPAAPHTKNLPLVLPELRHLHIKTGEQPAFWWPQTPLEAVQFSVGSYSSRQSRFPKIESIAIDDHAATQGLKAQFVYSMACAFLVPITVNHVGAASDIDEVLPWVCKAFP